MGPVFVPGPSVFENAGPGRGHRIAGGASQATPRQGAYRIVERVGPGGGQVSASTRTTASACRSPARSGRRKRAVWPVSTGATGLSHTSGRWVFTRGPIALPAASNRPRRETSGVDIPTHRQTRHGSWGACARAQGRRPDQPGRRAGGGGHAMSSAATMAPKSDAFSEAPPTRAPSTFAMAKISAAFVGFTEPP